MVPNSVLISLVVVPLREPDKVDVRARFPPTRARSRSRSSCCEAITVPTRYRPSVSLEELDADGVVLRVSATPLRPEDGSQLAEEVLEALRRQAEAHARSGRRPRRGRRRPRPRTKSPSCDLPDPGDRHVADAELAAAHVDPADGPAGESPRRSTCLGRDQQLFPDPFDVGR